MRINSGIAALLCAMFSSAAALAQTPPSPPQAAPGTPAGSRPSGTIVSGVVHDSLAGRPLIGAVVQLVADDAGNTFAGTIFSDSSGRYAFNDVPDGKYTLGFFHPILDSLGMQAFARAISVNRQGAIRADMAIPPAARMRDVLCGPRGPAGAGGVVIGTVLNANDRKPIKDVRVVGQWYEVSIGTGGVTRRNPRKIAMSNDDGTFVLCDVPASGAMSLMASRGTDSTGTVEVDVPKGGFLRSELYLGESMAVAIVVDPAATKDTLTLRADAVHVGAMRLTGTVIAVDGGNPMTNAVVGITNGPQTRTNDRGEWTIANAPAGSHTLEVRAVGKYPVRRSVNIINGVAPIRVAMTTFKAMLDTLKVTAGLSGAFDLMDFDKRRKTQGLGRFLTADDIQKRAPIETSFLFRNFPGLDVLPADFGNTKIMMKGVFSGDMCEPMIYINGTPTPGVTAEEIDNIVRPERIIGVEVYSATSMPPQFQSARTGCGSIVIWQRP
ncbi:MAG: carboxypeptidase regulatory-like domain-containing protein [Gemmatimonadaceae bacterium]